MRDPIAPEKRALMVDLYTHAGGIALVYAPENVVGDFEELHTLAHNLQRKGYVEIEDPQAKERLPLRLSYRGRRTVETCHWVDPPVSFTFEAYGPSEPAAWDWNWEHALAGMVTATCEDSDLSVTDVSFTVQRTLREGTGVLVHVTLQHGQSLDESWRLRNTLSESADNLIACEVRLQRLREWERLDVVHKKLAETERKTGRFAQILASSKRRAMDAKQYAELFLTYREVTRDISDLLAQLQNGG